MGRENHVSEAICWDFSFFALFTATWQTARKKKNLGRGNHFSEIGEWRLLGFAGISSFTVSTAAWRAAREKNDFWVGKIIFLKLETSDCWDLMGFLLLRCLLSKRLVVLAYIGGLSFFFLPYRFGGVGERGGMVLLHVNDPPFFTTPYVFFPSTPFKFLGSRQCSLARPGLQPIGLSTTS